MSTPQTNNPGSGSGGNTNVNANSGGKRGGGRGNRGRGGNRRGGGGGGGGGGRGGTQTQTQAQAQKEKGKNKNTNANTNAGGVPVQSQSQSQSPVQVQAQVTKQGKGQGEEAGEDEEDVCWICAEPIKYWSVSECNHRTCHVCALRLRALYKKTDCTFCKEPQLTVIFTTSPDTPFSAYKPEDIPYKDARLAIYFETQEMMEETMILLKFNCPDPSCDYLGNSWSDLKLHTRGVHGKLMCDLCLRVKKVFSHEHALYPPNILPIHLPSMHHRNVKQIAPEKVENGVHPMCEFCRECFFSVDEHYSHMREKHEECFVCKRNGVQFQYFENYNSLERHFNTIHHPCNRPECKERKFVVFNTPLDLQAHMVDEHGANMSSRDKRDARKIQAEFQFDEVGNRGARRGVGSTGSGTPRERDREPPPMQSQFPRLQDPGPSTTVTSGNGHGTFGQRQQGQGQVTGRRAAFGGSLTSPDSNPGTPPLRGISSGSVSPVFTDVDPSVTERHMIFLARLQSFAPNPTNAVTAAKLAIRGYRGSELSARDLILTIFNILDHNLDHTASTVNGLVDLLDEDDKKQDLLSSWRGFNIEQRRQFPELVPQSIGSGYAGITSGRVLNAKKTTASRSAQRTGQVWDRVAAAASSSASIQPATHPRFPALSSGVASGSNSGPVFKGKNTRMTAWSASATAGANRTPTGASVVEPRSVPATRAVRTGPPPPKLNKSVFPELPTLITTREKPKISGNVSLKNILGSTSPPVSVWGGEGSGSGVEETNGNGNGEGEEGSAAGRSGKGKKGKGKQKQTLFTLGTFPT